MEIKTNFNLDEIFGDIYKKFEEQIIPSLLEQMESVCLDVVSQAKQLNTYTDRTGNLRSSIGYVIYHDGRKIKANFEKVKDGDEGAKTGEQIADNAAKKYPDGTVSVVVAGMDYALDVESMGYDVIIGPASQLKDLMNERLRDIKDVYR